MMNKFFQFPLVRMLIAIVSVGIGITVGQSILNLSRSAFSIANTGLANLFAFVLITPATYFAYWVFVRYIEKRELTELSSLSAIPEFGIGSLIGFSLFAFVIAFLWILRCYRIDGFNVVWLSIIGALAGTLVSGFVQELIFRAIIFRITEEWLGTWWAIGISALLFGVIHLTSAGATIFSALSVALQAGVLLAAAYALTHRLWMALGIHMGWDFANDGVFGVGVAGQSGQHIPGILHARLSGPSLVTGGSLGVEASLITLVVTLIASFVLLQKVRQKRQWGSGSRKSWLTERLGNISQ